MALVHLVSFGIEDADGSSKRIPYFMLGTATDADLQAAINLIAPALDAAIDGKITDVKVTKVMTLPAGLKAAANAGSEVEKGALLAFSKANSTYGHSIFVPSWLPGQFSGNTPVTTPASVGLALVNALLAGDDSGFPGTDENGANLLAFRSGEKKFRK